MHDMFGGAQAFDADTSKWDVSGVTGMPDMFWGAISFNGDISKWDVSGVTGMHACVVRCDIMQCDVVCYGACAHTQVDRVWQPQNRSSLHTYFTDNVSG
jgi:hypothetical protein